MKKIKFYLKLMWMIPAIIFFVVLQYTAYFFADMCEALLNKLK